MMVKNQFQSNFFRKLPAELGLNIYGYMLVDFKGDTTPLKGAISGCHRLKAAIEDKASCEFTR
jgi:hypothetical protein